MIQASQHQSRKRKENHEGLLLLQGSYKPCNMAALGLP